MSENRSLAVLEILVHLAPSLPDRYLLGVAEFPDSFAIESLRDDRLPQNWATLDPREQAETKRIGDEWAAEQRSAVLSVPSVVVGERNYVLNPSHREFPLIEFSKPVPFELDVRLIRQRGGRRTNRPDTELARPH